MYFWFSLVFALGFALIHFFSKNMSFREIPRSKVLSFSAGVAVSYVFVHLLPNLSGHHQRVNEVFGERVLTFLRNPIFLLALTGLIVFYALERMVKLSKQKGGLTHAERADSGIFWVHMAFFFFYNADIGYLLVHEEFESLWGMFLYFLALSLHFVTNDRSLRGDHKEIYDRYGRHILTFAILLGWVLGVLIEVHELAIAFLEAFIAGGIVLNVLKEELPEERKSSISSFLIGAFGYSLLMMFV